MKKILFILLSVASMATAGAQDKVEANLGLDFVNQYIWRGQDLGNVSLQPTLGASWKGLSLSAWGSVGFDKDDTMNWTSHSAIALRALRWV